MPLVVVALTLVVEPQEILAGVAVIDEGAGIEVTVIVTDILLDTHGLRKDSTQ